MSYVEKANLDANRFYSELVFAEAVPTSVKGLCQQPLLTNRTVVGRTTHPRLGYKNAHNPHWRAQRRCITHSYYDIRRFFCVMRL